MPDLSSIEHYLKFLTMFEVSYCYMDTEVYCIDYLVHLYHLDFFNKYVVV